MRFNFLGVEIGFGEKRPGDEAKASATAPLVYVMYSGQTRGVAYKRNPTQYSDDAYRRNVIAFKAINEVARGAAKIPLRVMIGEKEAEPSHPLCVLLAKPNPWQAKASFFEAVYAYWLLTGNSYIEGVGPDGKPPMELWALRPDRTRVIPGPAGPAAYIYEVNGQSKTFPIDPIRGTSAILHVKFFNPLDDWYGMSPVEAAAYSVDAHNMAGEWNQALLQNGARPSGALTYKGTGTGPAILSDKQFDALKEQINSAYSGSRNAGRPLLLDGGLEWQQMSLTPAEMDWMNGKHLSSREIALAFGVPPQCLGIPGDNTYSNYQEARQALYQETVIPLLESLCDGLNGWLSPLFGENVKIVPYLEDLPALSAVREKRWLAVTQATWMTLNEKRQATGMEVIDNEGADEIFMPSTLVPLSGATEMDDGDETDTDAGNEAVDEGGDTQEVDPVDPSKPKPTVTAGDAMDAAVPVDAVQGTALNGAQITALVAIAQAVAAGDLSVEAAEALIRISFPAVADRAIADLTQALTSMGVKPKPKPVPPVAGQPPVPAPAPAPAPGKPTPGKPVPPKA
jgi:HK97 family phage portal protein